MPAENITAWFSYAGEQHELVSKVCDYLKPPAVEAIVQEAVGQLTKTSEEQVNDVRLQPKRYRLDENDDDAKAKRDPVYRLAPGCNINELTRDIANNPIRIMVLSQDYFKSQACLEELCLSLCANQGDPQSENNRLPMLILSGFKDDGVLKGESFDFVDPKQPGKIKSQSLLEALIAIHQKLDLVDEQGFDLSTEFVQKLPKIIIELSERVYVPITKDNIETVAVAIYRYGFSYLSKVNFSAHQSAVEGMYRDWCSNEFAKRLLKTIKRDFLTIRHDSDDAQQYLDEVYETLKNTRSLCDAVGSQEVVLRLYGLVILKCLKPIGANLLSAVINKNIPINVSVDNDQDHGFENAIHATLSYCANRGFTPFVNHQMAINELDKEQVAGVIFPHRASISGSSDNELLYVFQELLKYLSPYADCPRDEQQLHSKKFIRKIRAGLKSIRQSKYALLVLSLSLHRDLNGYYSLLGKMEQIINQGEAEKLTIPCVILRDDSIPGEEASNNLLFSQTAFDQFENQFHDVNDLFKSTAKNN